MPTNISARPRETLSGIRTFIVTRDRSLPEPAPVAATVTRRAVVRGARHPRRATCRTGSGRRGPFPGWSDLDRVETQAGSAPSHPNRQRSDGDAPNARRHVHTFANLVHADFRLPSTDYADLFEVTRALTRSHADLLRLLRLMLFNVAAHNRDDHAKNFAFVLDDRSGEWSFAPAYDLTFSDGPGGEHSSTVLGEGRRPTLAHCLTLAERFGIRTREAHAVADEVDAAIGRWTEFARASGCSGQMTTRCGSGMTTLRS